MKEKSSMCLSALEENRWVTACNDIEVLINPNGPFVEGCSLGDNGQTGRKPAMDFWGRESRSAAVL